MRSDDALADSHMREHCFPNRTGCIKRDGSRRSHNRCCKPRADHAMRSAGGLAAPRPPQRPRRPGRPKRSERKLSGAPRQVDHGRVLCQATSTTGATISAWFAHRKVSSTQPRSTSDLMLANRRHANPSENPSNTSGTPCASQPPSTASGSVEDFCPPPASSTRPRAHWTAAVAHLDAVSRSTACTVSSS